MSLQSPEKLLYLLYLYEENSKEEPYLLREIFSARDLTVPMSGTDRSPDARSPPTIFKTCHKLNKSKKNAFW